MYRFRHELKMIRRLKQLREADDLLIVELLERIVKRVPRSRSLDLFDVTLPEPVRWIV